MATPVSTQTTLDSQISERINEQILSIQTIGGYIYGIFNITCLLTAMILAISKDIQNSKTKYLKNKQVSNTVSNKSNNTTYRSPISLTSVVTSKDFIAIQKQNSDKKAVSVSDIGGISGIISGQENDRRCYQFIKDIFKSANKLRGI